MVTPDWYHHEVLMCQYAAHEWWTTEFVAYVNQISGAMLHMVAAVNRKDGSARVLCFYERHGKLIDAIDHEFMSSLGETPTDRALQKRHRTFTTTIRQLAHSADINFKMAGDTLGLAEAPIKILLRNDYEYLQAYLTAIALQRADLSPNRYAEKCYRVFYEVWDANLESRLRSFYGLLSTVLQPPVRTFLTESSHDERYFLSLLAEPHITDHIPDLATICDNDTELTIAIEHLAQNEHFMVSPDVGRLLQSNNRKVLRELVKSRHVGLIRQKFPMEWRALLKAQTTPTNWQYSQTVASMMAEDPDNCQYPEFRQFFSVASMDQLDISTSLAINPKAVQFPEYQLLFVLCPLAVAKNPAAQKFADRWSDLFAKTIRTVALCKEKPFSHADPESFHQDMVNGEGCADFAQYRHLFKVESHPCYMQNSINAMQFAEYNHIVEAVDFYTMQNPYSIYFPAFRGKIVEDRRDLYAKLPESTYFPEFRSYFRQSDWLYLTSTARNPSAPIAFPDEYRRLFDPTSIGIHRTHQQYVLEAVAENVNAVQFPEFRQLFHHPIDRVVMHALRNPNIWIFPDVTPFFHKRDRDFLLALAGNNGAAYFPEWRKMLTGAIFKEAFDSTLGGKLHDPSYLQMVAANPVATRFPEYARLFTIDPNEYESIALRILRNPMAASRFPSQYRQLLTRLMTHPDHNFYRMERILRAAVHNPNIRYHLRALEPSVERCSSHLKLYYVQSPFVTNGRLWHKLLNAPMRWEWRSYAAGFADNPKAVHTARFREFFKEIQTPMTASVQSDVWSTVTDRLAENRAMPTVYPDVFRRILHSNNIKAMQYALENPMAYPIIRPLILRHNPELIQVPDRPVLYFGRSPKTFWHCNDEGHQKE